jgi:hypothetical protein
MAGKTRRAQVFWSCDPTSARTLVRIERHTLGISATGVIGFAGGCSTLVIVLVVDIGG